MTDTEALELAGRVTCQGKALVQSALMEFAARNGEPTERLLNALRVDLTAAMRVTLRAYFGGSAGLE